MVLGSRTIVRENDLREMWGLITDDIYNYDHRDTYYQSTVDPLRKFPQLDQYSLVPLFPSTFQFEGDVFQKYALSMGNRADIADKLSRMSERPRRFCHSVLGREPSKVVFPDGQNLVGYEIAANVGIGTISEGGVSGGGIRSDSPFLLEIYTVTSPSVGERNLAAVVGFWAQDNVMLVSQMQSWRAATYPEGVPFGVASLYIAEVAARLMGFDKVLAYSAREHPIFREHSGDWKGMGADFTCIWDGSAKKLKYDGTRTTHYVKNLRDGTGAQPVVKMRSGR